MTMALASTAAVSRDFSTSASVDGRIESAKPVVLLVDDTPFNIDVLRGVLGGAYTLKVATSGRRPWRWHRCSRSRT